jgi:hypothetical protein
MYDSTTTVTVGLDVHARSVRLAAVRADELLEERTLPYDEEALERVLRRWPVVRCCYEAGPTGFGLQRFLVERGIDCVVVAPGLVPQRPGDRVKTDSRDARKLARLLAGGLLQPIHVPSRKLEAARDLVRAREDARLDRMRDRHGSRSSACGTGGRCRRARGPSLAATGFPSSALSSRPNKPPSTPTCHGRSRRRADRAAGARDPRDRRAGALASARRSLALPARSRHADRLRARHRDRRLQPLEKRRRVDGLRRPGALRAFQRPEAPTGLDHEGRQQPRPSTARRIGLARTPPTDSQLSARPPPTRPRRGRDRTRLALPATALPALAADGRPRQTAAKDRRRLRTRARRLRLGNCDRATTPQHLSHSLSTTSSGCVQPHGEPRSLYAAPAPAANPRP